MLQGSLPLPRALPRASRTPGQYRLPHGVADRLKTALAPFRNREAAFALAVFLGRFWSTPGRLGLPFVVDRVALADREDLGLTEARVRGAIKTLEAIGFLERWPPAGSAYRVTEHGLRRKPVGFTFGADYMPAFLAANRRAGKGRDGNRRPIRPLIPESRPRPSTAFPEPRPYSPEHRSEAEPKVYLGENLRLSPAALRAIGLAEGWRRGRGK